VTLFKQLGVALLWMMLLLGCLSVFSLVPEQIQTLKFLASRPESEANSNQSETAPLVVDKIPEIESTSPQLPQHSIIVRQVAPEALGEIPASDGELWLISNQDVVTKSEIQFAGRVEVECANGQYTAVAKGRYGLSVVPTDLQEGVTRQLHFIAADDVPLFQSLLKQSSTDFNADDHASLANDSSIENVKLNPHEFFLSGSGGWKLRLVVQEKPDASAPVSNGHVQLCWRGKVAHEARTDQHGVVAFENLDTGIYSILVACSQGVLATSVSLSLQEDLGSKQESDLQTLKIVSAKAVLIPVIQSLLFP